MSDIFDHEGEALERALNGEGEDQPDLDDLPEHLNVERLKRRAKKMSGTHTEALDRLAKHYGFHNWAHLMRSQK